MFPQTVGVARKFFVTGVKDLSTGVKDLSTGVKYMDSKVDFWFYSYRCQGSEYRCQVYGFQSGVLVYSYRGGGQGGAKCVEVLCVEEGGGGGGKMCRSSMRRNLYKLTKIFNDVLSEISQKRFRRSSRNFVTFETVI